MTERQRILSSAIAIMAVVSLAAAGGSIYLLYEAAFAGQRLRLREVAQSRARIIEAVARFDAGHSAADHPLGAEGATISQIADAHEAFKGFGDTGEFTLARRDGEQIVFLLNHRHGERERPRPIPFSSDLAEPMRRALIGESGTLVGLDYRGAKVLAAHEPVAQLGWGVVAKIDLAEIRAPFLKAGLLALGIAALCVIAGAALVLRLTSPLIERLEEHTLELIEARENLEARVAERTSELAAANEELRVEIEERHRAQEALYETASRTSAILDTALDGIITVDEAGVIESVNATALRIFGYSQEELIGQHVRILMPSPDREELERYLSHYLKTGDAGILGTRRELTGLRKDGTSFPQELVVGEVKLGERRLFTGTVRDLTERNRFLDALRATERRARAAEELASIGTLTAGLAHEVGTPMNVILGYAEMLQKSAIDEESRNRARMISEQVRRVSKIIQMLLNVARPSEPLQIPIDLSEPIEEAIGFLREKLRRRAITVERRFEKVPAIRGDREKLQQLFLNLFINAADAMPNGGILTVQLANHSSGTVEVRISDTGGGIPSESLGRLFDAFFTTKPRGKGSGLGLSVCRGIVLDHGGTIDVMSEVGKGTEFCIVLPSDPAAV